MANRPMSRTGQLKLNRKETLVLRNALGIDPIKAVTKAIRNSGEQTIS